MNLFDCCLDMDMTCESVEEICNSSCCEEFDTDAQPFLPCIVSVISLSSNNDNIEHNSNPVVLTDTFAPAERPPHSLRSVLKQSLIKREKINVDSHVVLEKLPERLVQSTKTSQIFVSNTSNALFLKTSGVDTPGVMQTFQLDGHRVKTEREESATASSEQATVSYPTIRQHLETVNPSVKMGLASRVISNRKAFHPYRVQSSSISQAAGGMAGAASTNAATSPSGAGVRSDRVERDISVILLKSAQLPKTSATAGPQDLSRLVLGMLQRQNISLQPVSNNDSMTSRMSHENEQQENTREDSEESLRKLLQTSDKAKAVLASKLKAEKAKVAYLLAKITSLERQLSNNSTNVQCTSCGSSSMDKQHVATP